MDLSMFLLASAALLLIAYACLMRRGRKHVALRIFTMLPVCVLAAALGYQLAVNEHYPESTEHYTSVGSLKAPVITYEGTQEGWHLFSSPDFFSADGLAVAEESLQLPVGAEEAGDQVRLYYPRNAKLEGVGAAVEVDGKTYALTDAVAAVVPAADQTIAAAAMAILLLAGFGLIWLAVLAVNAVKKDRTGLSARPALGKKRPEREDEEPELPENAPWPLKLLSLWRRCRRAVGVTAIGLALAVLLFYWFAIPAQRYRTACQRMEQQEYYAARRTFRSLLDYKDSYDKAGECTGRMLIGE